LLCPGGVARTLLLASSLVADVLRAGAVTLLLAFPHAARVDRGKRGGAGGGGREVASAASIAFMWWGRGLNCLHVPRCCWVEILSDMVVHLLCFE